jgi:hypothetical protein
MNIRLILKKRKKLDRSDPLRVKNDDVNRLVPTHIVLHLIYIWLSGDFFSFFHTVLQGGRDRKRKKRLPMCVCVYIVCEICLLWARFLVVHKYCRPDPWERPNHKKKERKNERECVCVCVYRLGGGEGFAYPYGIYSVREKNITSLLCGRGHPKRGVSKQAPYFFFWKEKNCSFYFLAFFLCYLSIYMSIYTHPTTTTTTTHNCIKYCAYSAIDFWRDDLKTVGCLLKIKSLYIFLCLAAIVVNVVRRVFSVSFVTVELLDCVYSPFPLPFRQLCLL